MKHYRQFGPVRKICADGSIVELAPAQELRINKTTGKVVLTKERFAISR